MVSLRLTAFFYAMLNNCISARRVHWFRSSAFAARWKEEVKLLQEEMRRTLRFHAYQRDSWNKHARAKTCNKELGAAAYAQKYVHGTSLP